MTQHLADDLTRAWRQGVDGLQVRTELRTPRCPPSPRPGPSTPRHCSQPRTEDPPAQAVREDVEPARDRAAAAADRYTLLTRGFQQSGRDEVAELQAALVELRSLPPLPLPTQQREQQAGLPPQTRTDQNEQRSGEEFAEAD